MADNPVHEAIQRRLASINAGEPQLAVEWDPTVEWDVNEDELHRDVMRAVARWWDDDDEEYDHG